MFDESSVTRAEGRQGDQLQEITLLVMLRQVAHKRRVILKSGIKQLPVTA